MGLQSIGGEYVHIEASGLPNIVQAWIDDARNMTHVMLSREQAVDLIQKLSAAIDREIADA
jgi:hypothetical protein